MAGDRVVARPTERTTASVPRAGLLGRLDGTTAPLVVVTAPAGYGKSVLVRQWAERSGRAAADPPSPADLDDPARLRARLSRVREGQLLLLDEVDRWPREAVAQVVVDLSDRLPPGAQVVVTRRSATTLRLGRARAEGRCLELRAADLAFDLAEVRQLLRLAGLDDDAATARAVLDATEGWPAGVHLTALALLDRSAGAPALPSPAGCHPFVREYVREEVLEPQPPALRRVLLLTAALDRVSRDLCEAALADPHAATALDALERRDALLVPADESGEWLRYNRLVGRALRSEVHAQDPAGEREVVRRAGDWYASQGDVPRAMEHWLRAGAVDDACRALNQHGAARIAVGGLPLVRRWTEALGDDGLARFPPALVTGAWVWALEGRGERAKALLLAADRSGYDGDMPDGHASLEAAATLLRAMMASSGVERMVRDARRAWSLEPPGSRWQGVCQTVLGIGLALTGDVEESRAMLGEVVEHGRERPLARSALAAAQLSLLEAWQGGWVAAARHSEEALRFLRAAACEERMTSVSTYLALATVEVHAQRRATARRFVALAQRRYLEVPPAGFPWLAAQTALVLADLCLRLDDRAAARTRVEDARRHLALLPDQGVLRQRLHDVSVHLARRGGSPLAASPLALSAAEQRVLQLLPTHLSLADIAAELFVSRNTVKAHAAAIYRKLAAGGRSEAVTTARALGLLEP